MAKKQTLNLTGSNFAAMKAVAEAYPKVVSCEITDSRWIIESVREVILEVTTHEDTVHVYVWVIDNGDKTYRTIFMYTQEKNAMSAQIRFNPTQITYFEIEEARKYGAKNAAVCEQLNAGSRFAFISDQNGQLTDEGEGLVDTYYSFIILADGTYMPLPIFFEACGIDYMAEVGTLYESERQHEGKTIKVVDGHEASSIQMAKYLKDKFGEQFMGWVNAPRTDNLYAHAGEFVPHHYWGELPVVPVLD